MEGKRLIGLDDVVPRMPELQFSFPVWWDIHEGEQWAIIGPNGSCKTVLADILQRRYALKEGEVIYPAGMTGSELIKSIAFKDIYSIADYRNSYYQQRWHSTETDEMPLVEELLGNHLGTPELDELLDLFHVRELLAKRIIFLSSGELRKFLVIRALLNRPRILILDNPFIGLDVASRALLVEMLEKMTSLKNVQVILLLSNPDDIPAMITHILPVHRMTVYQPRTQETFFIDKELLEILFPSSPNTPVLPEPSLPPPSGGRGVGRVDWDITLRMDNVNIRYGTRTILKDLNWEVKNGEKWALIGPNGSGKSTLLSLVYADNPQSYANNILLFDHKRGTGESIWDIKKRIGYVSPEMHMYYMENVPVLHIVGSGFFDSVGLYRKCNEEQQEIALQWMETIGIAHLKDRLFLTLSSGEQRLALLARAFVKNPDLLVLDEPLHGLDKTNKQKVIKLIETYCSQPGKTLIYVTHYLQELPACVDKRFELVKH
ncbi:MAG: ATP-binding cassette domain-containing protein [Tannerellaceae bacterium]|nr:ATP-binding cassette domain-containing protein [Tannerellaceae bacterium]